MPNTRILVIVTKHNPDNTALVSDQFFIDDTTKTKEVKVKGCVDWILFNVGSTTVYLYDNMPVHPNSSFTLPKSSPLPYQDNIKIRFETDYDVSRNIELMPQPPSQSA